MVDKKTVSFIRSLCMGQIEEDVILPFPSIPSAEKETLQGVVSSLEQLLKPREADFRHWDRQGEFPPAFIEELKSFGLFGFVIPEEHGGLAFGMLGNGRITSSSIWPMHNDRMKLTVFLSTTRTS